MPHTMRVGMHSDLSATDDRAGVAVLLHTHETSGAPRGQRMGAHQAPGRVRRVFRCSILVWCVFWATHPCIKYEICLGMTAASLGTK